ncbi:hypothetical protein EGW08_017663 [Elysia chlorotica]|uniref:UspA domain-containing protein n=1 Tax=Elysia chlorotica TaxID=188477 RepID=A0A433SZ67_ELYCH|nr:hypothetical protein EGW08_017663 [Elysia chlorotica]
MIDQPKSASESSTPAKVVVIPVEWCQLSKETFLWYLNTIHLSRHCVHVCYVPDFRRHLQPGMTPEEVMEIMIETNTESELLKKLYDALIEQRQIKGKFVRVGGNNRWCAIVEYCKLVDAVLLVLGTEPKPERLRWRNAAMESRSRGLKNNNTSTNPDKSKKNYSPPSQMKVGASESVASCVTDVTVDSEYSTYVPFWDSLKDVGPFAATVAQDVLDHCPCPAIVYRKPARAITGLSKRTESLGKNTSNYSQRKRSQSLSKLTLLAKEFTDGELLCE